MSAPLTGSLTLLRVLVVATAVGAASAAVLLRLRERAGELELETEVSARARDEARFEDRIAELEYQAETAEEQVKRLERRLLAQRSQLARAEGDNQRLLRERARLAAEQAARAAEEARRREAALRGIRPTPTAYLKAASVLRGLERRAAVGQAQRIAAKGSGRILDRVPALVPVAVPPPVAGPAPASVRLTVSRPEQQPQARPEIAAQAAPAAAAPTVPAAAAPSAPAAAASTGAAPTAAAPAAAPAAPAAPAPAAAAPAAPAEVDARAAAPAPARAKADADADAPIVAQGPAWARAALPPLRPAVTILPATLQRGAVRGSAHAGTSGHGTAAGTFNFFSRQETAISTDLGPVPADLADVVGEEAAAAQHRYDAVSRAAEPAAEQAGAALDAAAHGRGEDAAQTGGARAGAGLVDLTAEDETEPIDVRVLRAL
ncbi:hypothetical protein GXW83_31520 [Streptacidiphilus sp. PB12-B1b]|uniref:hypothetical protein n=1 Tax=Streptacidiphilus sp. PB12-B1b TaxID=2705012 RepID=UPI0015F78B71|nr:hypothetical protein [Streptacidiphilus sp. PB12-B1b]QMU79563.1 hypothetical protein GXW83_31520 [Streptacidiphilus sp. PB12-B1b]